MVVLYSPIFASLRPRRFVADPEGSEIQSHEPTVAAVELVLEYAEMGCSIVGISLGKKKTRATHDYGTWREPPGPRSSLSLP